ncbi:GAF domain-containing protein, partial [Arthrospira platensis SPKY1]|nr:GAF domain-containing protein [Arthrospira platensis SPKY1]
ERQSRYRELIQQLSLSFINLPIDELGDAIDGALARIGRFFDVDRAYVFDYDFAAGTTSNTHEWCAPGITSEIDNLQNLPIDVIPEWLAQHRRGEAMLLEDVSALPPGPLRDILEPQQIVSLITVPLIYDGACLGYVGIDIVRQPANR